MKNNPPPLVEFWERNFCRHNTQYDRLGVGRPSPCDLPDAGVSRASYLWLTHCGRAHWQNAPRSEIGEIGLSDGRHPGQNAIMSV